MCDNKYLYRYQSFENDEHINRIKDIFEKNELYFHSPDSFNDPFDCKSLYTIEGSSKTDKKNYLYEIFKHNDPPLKDNKINQNITYYLSLDESVLNQLLICDIHNRKEILI